MQCGGPVNSFASSGHRAAIQCIRRFVSVSLLTAIVDNIVFVLLFGLWPVILPCQALAHVAGATFNYFANKTVTFHSHARHVTAMPKYWLAVTAFSAISYGLILELRHFMPVLPAKILAEGSVFLVLGYPVQRWLVFRERKTGL